MTPNDIKDFAVSYEAFWDAHRKPEASRDRQDWNAVSVWARLLKMTQIAVNVEILSQATLDGHIAKAREEMAKIDSGIRLRLDDARREALQDAADLPADYEPNR